MSRKSDIALLAVTTASVVIAGAAIMVGQKAVGQSEAFSHECVLLREQNVALQAELADLKGKQTITKNELYVTVRSDEYARKSLARQNRNFCNIKTPGNGDLWKGQIGTDKFGHAIFSDASYGFRAAAITLRSYEHKHGLKTLEELVERFCQSNKDDYAKYLGKVLKIPTDKPFSYCSRMQDLLVAIARWESGESVSLDKIASL